MDELLKENIAFRYLLKSSQNLFSGHHSSKLKGQGLEFADLKEYVCGDDIRSIDWNVTARKGSAFVKEFLEDKDATHYFLVDVSGSVFNKISEMKKLIAVFLQSANYESDNFSVIFVAKDFLKIVPASKGRKHLMRCIYELANMSEKKKGDLDSGLLFLLNTVKKNSVVSIVSDELDFSSKFKSYLSALNKKHKVLYFQVYNSLEKDLALGLDVFEDSETGEEIMYDLSVDDIIEISEKYFMDLHNFERELKRSGIKSYLLDCKSDVVSGLKKQTLEL